jgi:Fe-Mn family superoxide dismutase
MLTDDEIKKILAGTLTRASGTVEGQRPVPSVNEAYNVDAKASFLSTERLSESNKRAHKELHERYVEALNTISAKLDTAKRGDASSNHSEFRSLKIDETYNHNGAYLHDLYFENISDLKSEITVDSLAFMRLERDFGDFDAWQRDFIACCMTSRCGWAITGYSVYLGRFINVSVDLHSLEAPVGFLPVIVMDTWQHAYYRDYLNDVKSYTIAMMKELNWNVISRRFKRIDAIAQAIKATEVRNG